MFDPAHIATQRARLNKVSAAQRYALVTLLGSPAQRLVSGECIGWVNDAGPRFRVDNTTMRALVSEGLAVVCGDGLARLTKRGRWYAMSSAADEADKLMAAFIEPEKYGYGK